MGNGGKAIIGAALAAGLLGLGGNAATVSAQALPGGTLNPYSVPKYADSLIIPPAMPKKATILQWSKGKVPRIKGRVDYYEIALRQFRQQILPAPLPKTKVWSYGAPQDPASFNYPAFTIEARHDRPVRVKWINDLKNPKTGAFLPHLFAVDQTLHWANPPGPRDMHGTDQSAYTGPVPMVVHVHGMHTAEDSDGYPEAWYLPDATDIPAGYFTEGTRYRQFRREFRDRTGKRWRPGTAIFEYPNDQRATTLWYHDHSLGMTRQNVYAGPAGFYLIRGGADDLPKGVLPGPAPRRGDSPGKRYHEIPIVIQDRSFNEDGSLFYPDNRAFFEGLLPAQLQIPFFPDLALGGGVSDVAPLWNPEFFGNTMVVNGRTWPNLNVEPRRYRFRFLNGSNSRFLILKMVTGEPTARPVGAALPFWQIGTEGGFLPAPLEMTDLLVAPAERADVVVDFTGLPAGTEVFLINEGPDEPFGGGIPGIDFDYADPGTTGQVMRFTVRRLRGDDPSVRPRRLVLPALTPLGPETNTRQVSLNEIVSSTVLVADVGGNLVEDLGGEPFGPIEADLGTVSGGLGVPRGWDEAITENPMVGETEVWEIFNFTEDAHPIHLHQVQFQVVDREDNDPGSPGYGTVRAPEAWEGGFKDTVIAYPGEITRVKTRFDIPGLFVWHCHILEHEDNEMMRPLFVGPMP